VKCEECGEKEATKELYLDYEEDGQDLSVYVELCEECYKKSREKNQ